MKVGDLVKTRLGYSPPGIVLRVMEVTPIQPVAYVKVCWPDHGPCMEKIRDLEILHAPRD